MTVLVLGIGAGITPAQSIAPVQGDDEYDRGQVDRYLDVELWTSNSDGEFYDGDEIVVYFRANRDAFVTLYSIDTRGRVNLLFPTHPSEDNYITGGVTYSLPGGDDDFDLVVSGPEGFENIQIIASRERFPIPDWFRGPQLVAGDDEDRDEYMDWVNATYFVDYGGQRFAYDRAVVYVNEWEEYYFRPVYHPIYPSWTVYGNAYIDYPWGASIYVNGIYWGCAPLYLPHIAVGWHTISIYDPYGWCWENDFHVSRYNTVVFNRTTINTSVSVKSKYKEVRMAGYRNPVQNGYPDFESRRVTMEGSLKKSGAVVSKSGQGGQSGNLDDALDSAPKKFVRGSTKLVKTDRGYETDASTAIFPDKANRRGNTSRTKEHQGFEQDKSSSGKSSTSDLDRSTKRGSGDKSQRSKSGGSTLERSRGKSSSSGSSGNAPKIEKRKTSGKTESGSIQKQSTPSKHSKPAGVTPSKGSKSGSSSSDGSNKGSKAPSSAGQKSGSSGGNSGSSSPAKGKGGNSDSGKPHKK
jgi:hypothetical protein